MLIIFSDYAEKGAMFFQDPVTNWKYAIIELHDIIIFYLIILLILVSWLFFNIFTEKDHLKDLDEGPNIECIWTFIPTGILFNIGFPSIELLFEKDDQFDPDLTIKIVGHQWYWTYTYQDYYYNNNNGIYIEYVDFDSYLVPEKDLSLGDLRLLTVDYSLLLPGLVNIRGCVTSEDVLHSFAIPSAGIKVDAMPGKLNSFFVNFNRYGQVYGQCSELCGVLHGFKPISLQIVEIDTFIEGMEGSIL